MGLSDLKAMLAHAGSGWSRTRARILLVLAVFVVLDAGLLFLVFRPPGRSPAERQADVKLAQSRYDSLLATVKQMRDLRTKLGSAIQNDEGFATEHFLDRKSAFSAMLTDLERLASENQLKTSNISYQLREETKQPGFAGVEVAMSVEGGYPELMQFINKLEQSDLFWIINMVTVSPPNNTNVPASQAERGLHLNLTMGTYAVL